MRLMHCPFCGEEERLRPFAVQVGIAARYCVTCDACGAQGPPTDSVHREVSKQTAIDDWNDRLPHGEDLALRTAFKMT
jgi:Lar family restriction alleviation protein